MAASAYEKRYEEVEFVPPEAWTKAQNADGSRTWTNTALATIKVTKLSGATQDHTNIPAGKATVRCQNGDVTIVVSA